MTKPVHTADPVGSFKRLLGLAAAGAAPRDTLAARTKGERPPVAKGDGRSARRTGRTAQLNLKVRPETAAEFKALAKARRLSLAELLESLLREAANA